MKCTITLSSDWLDWERKERTDNEESILKLLYTPYIFPPNPRHLHLFMQKGFSIKHNIKFISWLSKREMGSGILHKIFYKPITSHDVWVYEVVHQLTADGNSQPTKRKHHYIPPLSLQDHYVPPHYTTRY